MRGAGVLPLNEIGVLLREAREASGMSLEEVSEATKIRSKYLEAIEQGDFAVIPGEVYLKGFMRNYADCVGLDPIFGTLGHQGFGFMDHSFCLNSGRKPMEICPGR